MAEIALCCELCGEELQGTKEENYCHGCGSVVCDNHPGNATIIGPHSPEDHDIDADDD